MYRVGNAALNIVYKLINTPISFELTEQLHIKNENRVLQTEKQFRLQKKQYNKIVMKFDMPFSSVTIECIFHWNETTSSYKSVNSIKS